MKNKLYMMLFVCASFVGMVHTRLEAASEIPEMIVVSCVRGAVNSVTLSTNTIGTSLDILISSSGGSDTQLIGVVEWNATKQASDSKKLQISQLEAQPSGSPSDWPLFSTGCGDSSTSTDFQEIQFIQIESNVDPTSTGSTYDYSAGNTITNTSGTADLTGATGAATTYCGLIGVLSFYAVDNADNSTNTGTYRGSFIVSFVNP